MSPRRRRTEFARLRAAGWTVVVFRPWQRSRPIPLPDDLTRAGGRETDARPCGHWQDGRTEGRRSGDAGREVA